MALGRPPVVLDPALVGPDSAEPLWAVYTPPLTYRRAEGRDGTEVVPGVADRVPRASGDGRTYTLRVRNGLHFTSGRPVRAADVEHSILRARAVGPVGRHLFAGVARTSSDDNTRTVVLVLRRPRPLVPARPGRGAGGGGAGQRPMRAAPRPGRLRGHRPVPHRLGATRAALHTHPQPGLQPAERSGRPPRPRGRDVGRHPGRAARRRGRRQARRDRLPPPADRLPELRSELRERYSEYPDLDTMYLALRSRGAAFGKPKLRGARAGARQARGRAPARGTRPHHLQRAAPAAARVREPDCARGATPRAPDLVRARELVEEAGEIGPPVAVWASGPAAPVARSTWPRSGRSDSPPRGSRTKPRADVIGSSPRARRSPTRRASGPARRPRAARGGRRDPAHRRRAGERQRSGRARQLAERLDPDWWRAP